MTVTVDDVKAIHAEHVAAGRSAAEAIMGTRTAVHARLHLESPTPLGYACLTPEMKEQRDKSGRVLTRDERAAQIAHQASQVTSEQREAFYAARAKGDVNALLSPNEHHWVQMVHQSNLWQQADKLVADAGVK